MPNEYKNAEDVISSRSYRDKWVYTRHGVRGGARRENTRQTRPGRRGARHAPEAGAAASQFRLLTYRDQPWAVSRLSLLVIVNDHQSLKFNDLEKYPRTLVQLG